MALKGAGISRLLNPKALSIGGRLQNWNTRAQTPKMRHASFPKNRKPVRFELPSTCESSWPIEHAHFLHKFVKAQCSLLPTPPQPNGQCFLEDTSPSHTSNVPSASCPAPQLLRDHITSDKWRDPVPARSLAPWRPTYDSSCF